MWNRILHLLCGCEAGLPPAHEAYAQRRYVITCKVCGAKNIIMGYKVYHSETKQTYLEDPVWSKVISAE